jgi:chaperonin cofactor prefoldin
MDVNEIVDTLQEKEETIKLMIMMKITEEVKKQLTKLKTMIQSKRRRSRRRRK